MSEEPDAEELDDAIHSTITRLCERGDELADEDLFDEALAAYAEALKLLPQPLHRWEAATWIFAAIGDAHFFAGDPEAARRSFQEAMHCPDAIGNPFLHLRLGQLALEAGELDRAADELCRAFMGGGEEIFAEEEAKYLAFLKTRIDPPLGGWS